MMKQIRKVLIIAFVCLLVGGIGSIVAYSNYEPNSISESAEIDSAAINSLEVRAHNEKVEIIPTSDSAITVELTGKGIGNNENKLITEENGDVLAIETETENRKIFNFNFFEMSKKLVINLPLKEYESLQIENDNGSINMKELAIKDVYATTKNGKIDLQDISANKAEVSTNNGKIQLENIEGELIGKTNNGAISLLTKELDRAIHFQTDNGSIEIITEKEPTNAVLDTKTNNGSINLFDDSSYNMITGEGENTIKLRTKNGSISVTK